MTLKFILLKTVSKPLRYVAENFRKWVLWIPVLVLSIGGAISFHIYSDMRAKERQSLSNESAKRFQDMLSYLDLQLANSMLRVQSYEEYIEYIGSKPNSNTQATNFITKYLNSTLFQRLAIYRDLHVSRTVSPLPRLRVLARINVKNSIIPPASNGFMQSEDLLRAVEKMNLEGRGQQLALYELAKVPLVSYVLRSTVDRDVYFVFTTPLAKLVANVDLRPGENLFIGENLDVRSWNIRRVGQSNEIFSDPAGLIHQNLNAVHPDALSDSLAQAGFKLKFISDGEGNDRGFSGAFMAGSASLLMTLAIAFLFFVLTQHNSLVTRLVVERTQELVKVQHDLQETILGKSRFFGNISHEIRTPLNLILGMIDLCDEEPGTSERIKQNLVTMRSSGNHLLSLLEDLLDLAKAESHELHIQNKKINFIFLLEELSKIAGQDFQKKGLRFYAQLPYDLPLGIDCDPSRLRQILMNLLRNAYKYTSQGHVSLKVAVLKRSPQDLRLRFEITDSGVGIPDDKLSRIFDPFFQIEGSYASSEGGVGLGLAIVKQLLQKLGGQLEVKSYLKVGSTFQFDLSFKISDPQWWYESLKLSDEAQRTLFLVSEDPRWFGSLAGLAHLPQLALKQISPENLAIALDGIQNDPRAWVLIDSTFAGFSIDKLSDREGLRNIIISGNKKDLTSRTEFSRAVVIDNSPVLGTELLSQIGFSTHAKRRKEVASVSLGAPAVEVVKKNLSLIIADDDIGNKELYMAYFKSVPWNIRYALNGQEALDFYEREPADIVILDVRMPVMDGFEAVEKIRAFEASCKFDPKPIILVTADALSTTAERASKLSDVSFLTKPIKKSVILAEIQKVLCDVNA